MVQSRLAEKNFGKASEIYRLIDLKTSSSSNAQLKLSASGQNVISLDLAAALKGTPIDKKLAIKLSGMSRKEYLQKVYTMERLLDMQPPSSIQDICIRLGCSELSSAAERLLARHKETSPFAEKEHPMYAAGAIMAVAKQHRVAVDKTKLLELGRTRPRQLEEVRTLMLDTLKQMGGMKKPLVKGAQQRNQERRNNETGGEAATEEEDYETWKQRMLDEANAELDAENQTKEVS
ncbi:hypothetical protein B566_EDAN002558 [Ephemera danica]|nr:hypothetical protein B566_EDAN002558 [Ephemera danica]